MLTGQAAVMIEDQLEALQCSLGPILFLGVLESKQLCHDQAQKLNTSPWRMQLLKSFGLNHFLRNWGSRKIVSHVYGVITWEQHTCLQTLCFMQEQST